ncbi:MAG: hypothetical protein HY706_05905 [Candidatus Hydrogenedentes bacterium]|nr:hypothetical protein [Candidatus Hydrogenedentota bacterium]
MTSINDLWQSGDPQAWSDALARYWEYVQPSNLQLEQELETLDLAMVAELDALGWYDFLLHKYFRWKYTAKNRYATTTRCLRRYADEGKLDDLHLIKQRLLALDVIDLPHGLSVALNIRGLGTAGASGLLALMYPTTFATVDQFVLKALRTVQHLPEAVILEKLKPNALSVKAGVVLISIMQRKAAENNRRFRTTEWTPRKIDKILWTYGR